jgi:cell wall-associated NlpC family hydrolase
MRSRVSSARPAAKIALVVLLLASLSGIAVGIATQTSAAASKSGAARRTAHTTGPAANTTVAAPTQVATAAAATSPAENAILYFASREHGVANCSGGNGWYGPAKVSGCTGFGCMSLAQFAVYQGTGGKVALPGNGTQLQGVGHVIPPHPGPATQANLIVGLEPGDVTYWGGSLANYQHSGIYVGNGMIWDAVGDFPVEEHSFTTLLSKVQPYGYTYDGAIRYTSLPLLSVSTKALATGSVYAQTKRTYSDKVAATAGKPPYRWSLAKGSKSLPPGLTLAGNGVISGRATRAGTYPIDLQVTDTKTTKLVQQTATRALSIRIT